MRTIAIGIAGFLVCGIVVAGAVRWGGLFGNLSSGAGAEFVIDQSQDSGAKVESVLAETGFVPLQVIPNQNNDSPQSVPSPYPRLQFVPKFDQASYWNVEADGSRFTFENAANVEFDWQEDIGAPVFAALNGPFVLRPIEGTPRGNGKAQTEVVDLRTGMPVGAFSTGVYFKPHVVLSPNGRNLVGFSDASAVSALAIDKAEALHSLSLENRSVHWMDFVSKSHVCFLISDKKQGSTKHIDRLIIWDIESGESQRQVELPGDSASYYSEKLVRPCVASSPRGKYLAVIGNQKLYLIQTANLEILGSIPIPGLTLHDASVRFSDDAKSLFVSSMTPASNLHVLEFDALNGKIKTQREYNCSTPIDRIRNDEQFFLYGGPVWVTGNYAVYSGGPGRANAYRPLIVSEMAPQAKLLNYELIPRMMDTGPAWVAVMNGTALRIKQEPRDLVLQAIDKETDGNSFGKIAGPNLVPVGDEAEVFDGKSQSSWTSLSKTTPLDKVDLKELDCSPRHLIFVKDAIVSMNERYKQFASGLQQWEATFRKHDPSTGSPGEETPVLRQWSRNSMDGYIGYAVQEVFHAAPDGNCYASSDPEQQDMVHVIGKDGARLFSMQPFGKTTQYEQKKIINLHYLDNKKLFVASVGGVGVLSFEEGMPRWAWRNPLRTYGSAIVLPGNTHAAIARAKHIEILDLQNGKVQGQLACPEGIVRQLNASEDCGWLAASLESVGKAVVLVWSLQTGEGIELEKSERLPTRLVWLSPDHLVVLATTQGDTKKQLHKVFDMGLKKQTFSYLIPQMGTYAEPDGTNRLGVWLKDTSRFTNTDGPFVAPRWNRVNSMPEEKALMADDRKTVPSSEVLVSIHLNLRQYAWGKKHGPQIAKSIQEKGFKIAKGSYQVHLKTSSVPSGEQISQVTSKGKTLAKLPIPKVVYRWSLRDASGHDIWEGTSEGKYLGTNSKYFRGNNSWDFGSKDMDQGLTDEIIENGVGLELPKDFPTMLVEGGGASVAVPTVLKWQVESRE